MTEKDTKKDPQKELLKKFAAKVDETSPASLNNLGAFFYTKKMYFEAIEAFQKALDLNPKYSLALKNIAQAIKKVLEGEYDLEKESDGKYVFTNEDAIEYFKKAIKLQSDMDDAYNAMGEIYYHQGFYDISMKLFKKSIKINPKNAIAHYNLSFLYGEKVCLIKHKKNTILQLLLIRTLPKPKE